MKKISLITLVSAVICLTMEYALDYYFGYYQNSISPIVWSMNLTLVEFSILPLVLLITWIASMILRKHRFWTTAMLIGLLTLIGLQLTIMPPSHHLIVYSMKNRMMRDYSLDDLRHFARDFDQLPRLPDNEPGPTKAFRGWDLDKTGLKVKYPFLSWVKGPGFEGPSFIIERDGVVNARWGSALAGHWGFSVAVNGARANPSSSDVKILRVSDDIFFIAD
jgi:hypothetical protein